MIVARNPHVGRAERAHLRDLLHVSVGNIEYLGHLLYPPSSVGESRAKVYHTAQDTVAESDVGGPTWKSALWDGLDTRVLL